jgi:undecaprenyl-diphosphatase
MPTMVGAFAYDLYKNWAILQPEDVANIAVGFVTAFIAAVFVVRYLLDYVSRHGFSLFGWWRIIVGSLALGAMLMLG